MAIRLLAKQENNKSPQIFKKSLLTLNNMNTDVFPQNGAESKLKSYWNRPGGKFGTVVGLAALGAIGYYVLPILTTVVWNTVNFGIACVVAFLLYVMLTNRKLWLSFFYLYEILMKKLVGVVIELDPFIIAEDYIQDIEKERDNLYNKSIEVDAQKEAIEAKIKDKLRDKQKQLDIAAEAQKRGMAMEVANATRQVSRLDLYVQQLTPIKENLTKIGNYLTQVHKNSKYMLEDMKNDLDLKKDLYKSVTKGNHALKSALAIFNGDPEKKMLVEQSMDYLKDDIANKLASMKKAISYSSDFMTSIDLENASYQAEGLRMLEEYKPDLFTYNENREPINVPSATVNKYENLL
jgi:hypothetical protein